MAFKMKLREVYALIEGSEQDTDGDQWAKCCRTVISHEHPELLGHPAAQRVLLRKLRSQEGLDSEEKLREYLLKRLPRDFEGLIMLPEINMRHPFAQQPQEGQALLTNENKRQNHQFMKEELKKAHEKNQHLSQEVAELRNCLDQVKVA